MVTLDLRIDELVLHGIQPSRRAAIEDAFRAELGRLLMQRVDGDHTFREARSAVRTAHLRIPAGAPDAVIGRRLARTTARVIDRLSGQHAGNTVNPVGFRAASATPARPVTGRGRP